jgi:hypothetical protein
MERRIPVRRVGSVYKHKVKVKVKDRMGRLESGAVVGTMGKDMDRT